MLNYFFFLPNAILDSIYVAKANNMKAINLGNNVIFIKIILIFQSKFLRKNDY